MIYLDNAATTLHKPEAVIEAVTAAMTTAGNPGRGAHGASLGAAGTVYDTRRKLAALFGCPRADHVIFTANATGALNIAIYGLLGPEDHAITTDLEQADDHLRRILVGLVVQTVGTAEIRDTAFRGNAGAAEKNDAL